MILMNRRQFLGFLAAACGSLSVGKINAHAKGMSKLRRGTLPMGMYIIDAHAHPDHFYLPGCTICDHPLDQIIEIGMNASSFAAVGDFAYSHPTVSFGELLMQLDYVKNLEEAGRVKIIRQISDIPHVERAPGFAPGAILSVEGGTPLEENPDRVDELYEYGVRLITLMHYRVNAIGDIMTPIPDGIVPNGGLTDAGRAIVERMFHLGMVVDVAHAHIDTLRGIADIALHYGKPIIDSHTSPSYLETPVDPIRLRSWAEMEMVAETGGIICTWPLKVSKPGRRSNRETLLDWAKESLHLKERLGIEHIGLGTDQGGGLPEVVAGWESILNIVDLAEAMLDVGFTKREVSAYMGGNFLRVLKQSIR
jgi:membrane dipeptidase